VHFSQKRAHLVAKQLAVSGVDFERNTGGIFRYYMRAAKYLQKLEQEQAMLKDSLEKIQQHIKAVEAQRDTLMEQNQQLQQQLAETVTDSAAVDAFAASLSATPAPAPVAAVPTPVTAAVPSGGGAVKSVVPLIDRLG
jgi:septal ring factor EnvC (AmiA/AmiB activator)